MLHIWDAMGPLCTVPTLQGRQAQSETRNIEVADSNGTEDVLSTCDGQPGGPACCGGRLGLR